MPVPRAEREGFEPSDPVTQVNSLAVNPIRPLSHLSLHSSLGHPAPPHWRRPTDMKVLVNREKPGLVATVSTAQTRARGISSQILGHCCLQLDHAKLIRYLETDSEDKVRLHKNFGSEVVRAPTPSYSAVMRQLRFWSWMMPLIAAVSLTGATCVGSSGATTTAAVPTSWTVYHGDAAGSGYAPSVTAVDTDSPAWSSPALDGSLYGEPLVSSGYVYVATENDTVYELSASNGAVVWSTHIASPVPASSLPCGDISPTVGITGTPVIDQAKHEIFVVADELVSGKPSHVLVGLNTASGARELTQNIDPSGADPAALLQRTGLTLDAGQVIFGMGGNYGDCSTYRGTVVSVNEAGGTPAYFTVDSAANEDQGSIWMGGAAPAVDGNGNIWVSTGNGSVHSAGQPYDDSDSALELSSSLQLLQYFAPSTWAQNNAEDLDMSMAPSLLSNGQVLLAGKSRIVYLLDGAHLGGIGGQVASLGSACSDDIDGGSAVVGTTVYVPCVSGPVAVDVTASGLSLEWRATVGGGPPIVAAGLVWTIGQNGVLYGLDPSTGLVKQQAPIGTPANHFPTPGIGDGLLLASSAAHVIAFSASSPSAATTSTTTTTVAPPSTVPSNHPKPQVRSSKSGGFPPGAIAGIAVGALVVIAGAFVLLRRRRRHGRA
jgi:outer membrane protein assembly factor BamB